MTTEGERRAYSPRFVGRIFDLLQLLTEDEQGKTLAELARRLDVPKSSILNIIKPMTERELLIHAHDRYRVGPGLFGLGYRLVGLRKATVALKEILQRVVETCGESVYVATLDPEARRVRYIDGCESAHTVRYVAKIGEDRPLHCGAGATVLLAAQPPEWAERVLREEPLPAVTPRTETDPDRVLAGLETVRATGVAVSFGEASVSGAGIAAPIRNAEGDVVAALVIATPVDRFEAARADLERLVRSAASDATGLV